MVIEDDPEDLAGYIRQLWPVARDGRRRTLIENEWWNALRQWRGEYDDETKARLQQRKNQSQVFVKLTRSVVGGAAALLMHLFADDDGNFPWSIAPTDIPDLEGVDIDMLKDATAQAAGMVPEQIREQFLREHDWDEVVAQKVREARLRCDRMEKVIRDQLEEMRWNEEFWAAIVPHLIYGTTVVQGPLTKLKKPSRWMRDSSGTWRRALDNSHDIYHPSGSLVDNASLRPEMKILDIWTVYPDPTGFKRRDLEYVFVRHVLTRRQLNALKYKPNFVSSAIDVVLNSHPNKGNWQPQWWEWAIHKNHVESRYTDHFEVLEFTGYITGRKLARYVQEDIPEHLLNETVLASVWFCANEIIKCVVLNNDQDELPFLFVPYELYPGRIWGRGIPAQMDDSQDRYNACERAKMDNMAEAAIPQRIVDVSRITDNCDPKTFFPGKTWTVKDLEGLSVDPVKYLVTPPNFQHIHAIQSDILLHIQKETNLPDFAIGLSTSTTHNRTAEGLDMQRNMALTFIRSVIGNIDIFLTAPMIRALYDWNMAYNPDESIKGDYEIKARGVVGAISKEAMMTKLMGLMNQFGSELKYIIDTEKLGQLFAKGMGLADAGLTRTLEEAQALKKQDMDMQAQQTLQSNRLSPTTPPMNAALEVLQHCKNIAQPAVGVALENVVNLYGWMNPKWQAAIDAINAQVAKMVQHDIPPQETQAILQQTQLNKPAYGVQVQEQPSQPQVQEQSPENPQQPLGG